MNMDITLSKDFKTLRIYHPKLEAILDTGNYECINVCVNSCVCPTESCGENEPVITGEESIATVRIPKINEVIIEKINFEYQFSGKTINVIRTPIYYDSNHDVLLTALYNQMVSSLEQYGFPEAPEIVLQKISEDNGFVTFEIKNLPQALLPKDVVYSIFDIKKTEPFSHSTELSAFASRTHLYIGAKAICRDVFVNDVLTISITVITTEGLCISLNFCYFVDVDLKCRVAEHLDKLSKGQIQFHLLYFGLKEASGCIEDCSLMCELLKQLLQKLDNECTNCN